MFLGRSRRLLTGLSALAALCAGVLLAFDTRVEYRRELEATYAQLEADAHLLAKHAELSMVATDVLLTQVDAYIRSEGLEALAGNEGYPVALLRTIRRTPQLRSLAVADAQGRVQFSTVTRVRGEVNIADRTYFQAHRAGAEEHIGEPIVGRLSGDRLIPVSIPINGPQDGFNGVIVAALDQAYFAAFYQGMRENYHLRIGMARLDGTVLSLDPAPTPIGGFPPPVQDAIAASLADANARPSISTSPIDGVKMIRTYRHLDDYPVAVWASYPYQRFLADLYPLFLRNAIILAALIGGGAVSLLVILRQLRAADEARSELESVNHQQQALLERTQRAVAAREEILRIVSHDIRTPLATIVLSTSLATRDMTSDELRQRIPQHLSLIQRAAQRIQRLTNDLQDFGSIEAGRLTVRLDPNDPLTIAYDAIESSHTAARQGGLVLKPDLPARLPYACCDRDRVLQVLGNLLANAIKITPSDGTVIVGVRANEQEATFYVSDTGPGVSPAELPHLFDRYWRSQRAGYKGTGLGLAIAKGIIDAHGGRIWAESTLGKGSTFYFTVPLVPS